jgi:hypothetical protein
MVDSNILAEKMSNLSIPSLNQQTITFSTGSTDTMTDGIHVNTQENQTIWEELEKKAFERLPLQNGNFNLKSSESYECAVGGMIKSSDQ